MILIVGLGNPGTKYAKTRHNLGFMVVEQLAKDLDAVWKDDKKFDVMIAKIDERLILIKPQTFMNASGFAVAKVARYYRIKPENIWLIHDDVDLPPGKLRIREGGGTGGHRGVTSVMEQLGTDIFVRFRLGVGHPREQEGGDWELDNYVLQKIPTTTAKNLVKKAVEAIQIALEKDLKKAMNRYNS